MSDQGQEDSLSKGPETEDPAVTGTQGAPESHLKVDATSEQVPRLADWPQAEISEPRGSDDALRPLEHRDREDYGNWERIIAQSGGEQQWVGLSSNRSEARQSAQELQRLVSNFGGDVGYARVNQNFHYYLAQQSAGTASRSSSRVRWIVGSQERELAEGIFVEPDGFAETCQRLKEQHCQVIFGRPHLGKRTAALYLALKLFRNTHQLYELSPDTDLRFTSWLQDLDAGCFYLLNLTDSHRSLPREAGAWRELGQQLAGLNCYLVVCLDDTSHPGSALAPEFYTEWKLPTQPRTVVTRHLTYFLAQARRLGDPGYTEEQALAALADEEIVEFLKGDLPPARLGRLAEQIGRYCVGEYGALSEAIAIIRELDDDAVREQFRRARTDSERAFHLALAVFNNERLGVVEDAAHMLEELLTPEPENEGAQTVKVTSKAASYSLFDDPLQPKLERVNARLVKAQFPGLAAPVEVVQLRDPAYKEALLSYVWRNYGSLRRILLTWLRDLGGNSSLRVRLKTAAAVACLARLDYLEVVSQVLFPWAAAAEREHRQTLSFAFSLIVQTEGLTVDALNKLRTWSEAGQHNLHLVWAAARVYGEVGQIEPLEAMQRWQAIFASYLFPPDGCESPLNAAVRWSLYSSIMDTLGNFLTATLTLPTNRFVYVLSGVLSGLRSWIDMKNNRLFSTHVVLRIFQDLMSIRMNDGQEHESDRSGTDNAERPSSPPALLMLVDVLRKEAARDRQPVLPTTSALETQPAIQELGRLMSVAIRTPEARMDLIQERLYEWLTFVERDGQYYPALVEALRALLRDPDFAHKRWQRELGLPLENWAYSSSRPQKVAGRLVRDLSIHR